MYVIIQMILFNTKMDFWMDEWKKEVRD